MEEHHRDIMAQITKRVDYMHGIEEKKSDHEIFFQLMREGDNLRVFDSKKHLLKTNPMKEMMFVAEKDSDTGNIRIFVGDTEEGVRHHSGLADGDNIFMAGTIKTRGGEIIFDNQSGHFRPSENEMIRFIKDLYRQLKSRFSTDDESTPVDTFFKNRLKIKVFKPEEESGDIIPTKERSAFSLISK